MKICFNVLVVKSEKVKETERRMMKRCVFKMIAVYLSITLFCMAIPQNVQATTVSSGDLLEITESVEDGDIVAESVLENVTVNTEQELTEIMPTYTEYSTDDYRVSMHGPVIIGLN